MKAADAVVVTSATSPQIPREPAYKVFAAAGLSGIGPVGSK